jgi:predicted amidohydrolase YtcJ
MTQFAAPDLLVINGDIRTMDPLQPRAQALASRGGRIVAVGSNDQIKALGNGRTRTVNAGGKLVLPGFQDTHIHLQDSGTGFSSSVNLEGAKTIEDLQQRLRDFAKGTNDLWVKGTGWYSGIFGAQNLNRQVLDAAVPDRPVFIFAADGHNAAVNTKACEIMGLDASVADPAGGSFVREPDHTPTGLIYEDAIDWVRARMPKTNLDVYTKGVQYGQKLCNTHGITGVLDAMVWERHMKVYRALDEAGELSVRLCATAKVFPTESVKDATGRLEALRRDYRTGNISVHSAKFFLDGVVENRTAAMIEDYSDKTGGNAPIMFDEEHLTELFIAFDAARFQLHVHVIGDRATHVALDRIEIARDLNGAWPSLHQLAHVQLIHPDDIPRLRQLGVVTNMQPLWARCEPSVTEMALPFVGEARGRWMYPWRTIVDSGAPYAVSSDWGVSTLNPFPIMQTAITRQPANVRDDFPIFQEQERMTVEQVVQGYTTRAAAAAWRSDETGSLTLGKHADLIILDRDIFTVDPSEIGDTEVELTLLGGREVHRSAGFAG